MKIETIEATVTLALDNKPIVIPIVLPNIPEVGQFLVFATKKIQGRCEIKSIAYELTDAKNKTVCAKLLINAGPIFTSKPKKETKSLAEMRSASKKRSKA